MSKTRNDMGELFDFSPEDFEWLDKQELINDKDYFKLSEKEQQNLFKQIDLQILKDVLKNRNNIIYSFVNIETEEDFVGTQHELCLAYKLDTSTISKVILGKRKSHKGWMCVSDFSLI